MPASGPEPDHSLDRLSDVQRRLLTEWLGAHRVVADHSWPLQTTAVLELDSPAGHVIAKASTGALMEHHLTREIIAHCEFLAHVSGVPRLVAADAEARLLVTRFVPGVLVEGTAWEREPAVYRQAGRILAAVHSSRPQRADPEYGPRVRRQAAEYLQRARDLLDQDSHRAAEQLLATTQPGELVVVPTHGDAQPRNLLVDPTEQDDDGPRVTLIDFGRAAWRPWYSDLVRLHHQTFTDHPELAAAFYDGAGWDFPYPVRPAERHGWVLENLFQSVTTVVWATDLGDLAFAEAGRRMLARVLAEA